MRILVVDDDAVFREEFSAFLSDEGHRVEVAPSVVKALEVLEGTEFEVVFTDLKMPRQSGLELLAEARRRWPGLFVVVVTGFATVQTAVEAMKRGAFDYVGKPFRTEQVRQVLALIAEQLKFDEPRLASGDATDFAEKIAARTSAPVLLAAPQRPARSLSGGVEWFEFDGREPFRLKGELESFVRRHGRGTLVIARADQMLEDHRLEAVVALLEELRGILDGKGTLAVGVEPGRLSEAKARALAAAVAAPAVHGALEAIANPIRRRVLHRLDVGAASFSELMRAASLDDSPKFSFHLHRLVEETLIAHVAEQYRITEKGRMAVGVLTDMETLAAGGTQGSFLFQVAGSDSAPNA